MYLRLKVLRRRRILGVCESVRNLIKEQVNNEEVSSCE